MIDHVAHAAVDDGVPLALRERARDRHEGARGELGVSRVVHRGAEDAHRRLVLVGVEVSGDHDAGGGLAIEDRVDEEARFEGLAALVRDELGEDVLSGDLYLFTGKNRKRAKVLLWDGTGLCLFAKRLEKGRFAALWRDAERARLRLTLTELQLFLEGSALVCTILLSPRALYEDVLCPCARIR